MSAPEAFFDTSILLYLLSDDTAKADRAEHLLAGGGAISVQVLNEFAAVAIRKLRMPIVDVREVLETVKAVCHIVPVDLETHERGLAIAERYRLSFYDSLIAASALQLGTKMLYSEDLQHGQVLDRTLKIVNPFIK